MYNADSGVANKTLDFLHKAVSPATYQCSLCAITYGTFSIKQEWKEFIAILPYKAEFWYKNDFAGEFTAAFEFPCILFKENGSLKLLIGADEMKKASLPELKALLTEKLSLS